MAQRRMRLKRGKEGDTGVVLPPAPPTASPIGERSPFDEDLIKEIIAMAGWPNEIVSRLGGINDRDVVYAFAERIAKLALSTKNVSDVLNPRPASTSPVTVTNILVDINMGVRLFNTLGGFSGHVATGRKSVTITVEGDGHPADMLRTAAANIHSNITTIRTHD